MQADDKLCLCFHVTFRKVINFARIHKIKHPSQLAGCFGAGTGCGWCRATLKTIGNRVIQDGFPDHEDVEGWVAELGINKEKYGIARQQFRQPKDSDGS